jgi:cytochrome P450
MDEATVGQPPAIGAPRRPPGPWLPAPVQAARFLRSPLDFYVGLNRKYGDIYRVSRPLLGEVVHLASPQLIKTAFTSPPTQVHAGEANERLLEPVFGPSSVMTLDEGLHMRQRKLLLPAFHGEQVQRYGEVMRQVATQEMQSWPVGEPFKLHHYTHRIALGVILQCIFGVRGATRLERVAHLIEKVLGPANVVMVMPALRRNLGPLSPWARFLRARNALDEFIFEEIEIHRSMAGEVEGNSVLDMLLEARDEDGNPMTQSELRDELMTMIGAGSGTTATMMAWTMERVLRSPRVLAKLRETLADGDQEYLGATIKETLRMRPVIPEVMRKLAEPLEIGGYELEAGMRVGPAIAAMHYREDLFPEPYEFRPERFIEEKADNYAWIPFGGGVRRCIGAAFADFEMRNVLSTFIERAELSVPDPAPERVAFKEASLCPAKGTLVTLDRPLS